MAARVGASEDAMDSQNRLMSEQLSKKVATLKSIAFEMENDAKDDVRLLNYADDDFDSVKGFLSGSMHRVNKMIGRGRSNRKIMCYISLLLVIVFIIVYYTLNRIV